MADQEEATAVLEPTDQAVPDAAAPKPNGAATDFDKIGDAIKKLQGNAGKDAPAAKDPSPTDKKPAPKDKPTPAADAHEGADAEKPKLSTKHVEAIRKAGLDVAKFEAMGEQGIAIAEAMAAQRSHADRLAGELGKLKAAKKPDASDPARGKRAGDVSSADLDFTPFNEDEAWSDPEATVKQVNARLEKAKAAFESYASKLADLKAENQTLREDADRWQAEQAKRAESELDDYFAGLNKDFYGKVFGIGPSSELDPDGPELSARVEIKALAESILEQAKKSGRSMTAAQAREASRAAFDPDTFEKHARHKQTKAATAARHGSGIAPGGAPAVGPKTDESVSKLAQSLRESGLAR